MKADLRFVLRMAARRPAFAAFVTLVLALGIGANAAIFNLVDQSLLRRLPYRDPARLVLVSRADSEQTESAFSPLLFDAIRRRASALSSLAAFQYESFNLTGGGAPERLPGMVVSANLFSTLGVEPQLGRVFQAGEDEPGAPRRVVLSHHFWMRHFAADRQIVGRSITLNDESYTVVGVMPASFRFDRGEGLPAGFDFSSNVDLWAPLQVAPTDQRDYLLSVGRLADGVSLSRAQAAMNLAGRQLEHERTGFPRGLGFPLARLDREVVRPIRPALLILVGAAGLLLLLACANVANLLLVRAAARQAEFSIRASLGAGRWRLARQLVLECCLYAVAGGVAGLLTGNAMLNFGLRLSPSGMLRIDQAPIHWHAVVACLLLSFAAGAALGIVPFAAASRVDLYAALKRGRAGGGREARPLRRVLVCSEIGLAFVLLVGAGLLMESFRHLLAIDPGFQPDRVLTAQIDLPPTRYPDGPAMLAFFRRALDNLRASPAVAAAGAVTILPLGGLDRNGPGFRIIGPSSTAGEIMPSVSMPLVSAGYLEAMGIRLRKGRYFRDADNEHAPGAAIINEACARRWFSSADPIGQQLSALGGRVRFTVIGVAADVRHWGLETAPQPMIYVPYSQVPRQSMAVLIRPMTLVVRGRTSIAPLAALIEQAVHRIDREQPVSSLRPMLEVVGRSLAQRRLLLTLAAAFGLAAWALAMIGIYGVVSYSVEQRTGEIGIRLALGAHPASIRRAILRQSMAPALLGIAWGAVAALACGRAMAGLLYGVGPSDLRTLLAIATLLAGGSLIAAWRPARRAAALDPLAALRHE